jgi:DNA-binding FadR family transcriptional regulator
MIIRLAMPTSAKAASASRKPPARREKANIHQQLAQNIGMQILGGVYAPGAILPNEADWCRIYGASRTSVREAIKALNAKGLLVSRPKIGSRVEPRENWNLLDRDVLRWHGATKDPQEFLLSVQELRKVLEPEVAALAAQRRTPRQIEAIETALTGMKRAATRADTVKPANNDLLTPFGIVIESALATLFEFTSVQNPMHRVAIGLHEDIFKAVKAGNPKAARLATRRLLANTDDTVSRKHVNTPRRRKTARA